MMLLEKQSVLLMTATQLEQRQKRQVLSEKQLLKSLQKTISPLSSLIVVHMCTMVA